MTRNGDFDVLKAKLAEISQDQVVGFAGELTSDRLSPLLVQVKKLDFSKIPAWVDQYVLNDGSLKVPEVV